MANVTLPSLLLDYAVIGDSWPTVAEWWHWLLTGRIEVLVPPPPLPPHIVEIANGLLAPFRFPFSFPTSPWPRWHKVRLLLLLPPPPSPLCTHLPLPPTHARRGGGGGGGHNGGLTFAFQIIGRCRSLLSRVDLQPVRWGAAAVFNLRVPGHRDDPRVGHHAAVGSQVLCPVGQGG